MGDLSDTVASVLHRGAPTIQNHPGPFKDLNELLVEPSPFPDASIGFEGAYHGGVPYDDGFYESESSLTSPHSDSAIGASDSSYGMYEHMHNGEEYYLHGAATVPTHMDPASGYRLPFVQHTTTHGAHAQAPMEWHGSESAVPNWQRQQMVVHAPGSPSSGSEEARSDSEDTIEHQSNIAFANGQQHPQQTQFQSAPMASGVQHLDLSRLASSTNTTAMPMQFYGNAQSYSGQAISEKVTNPRAVLPSSQASTTSKPRAKRAKVDETANRASASPHMVSFPTQPDALPTNFKQSQSASPIAASPSAATQSTSSRVRRSAALAAKAIKSEMMDSFEPANDDDDIDVAPGAGPHRKRKRGEQQKAKHNVAEKKRRIEMNDAMDRIKACLSQGDRMDEPRGTPTKVSILLETADHMESLQRENERLKAQVQSLSTRVQVLEHEVSHYRGESTDDDTSMVSSPSTERASPRSRLAMSMTSATLLTIIFCLAWTPAQNLIHSHLPDTVALSRTLMEHAEASSWEFIFRVIHLLTENVLPVITFAISLLITLYMYSVFMRPIIRDADLIAAHLETVTAIHGARIHSGKSAWMKTLKLSQALGIKPPSALMSIPHIIYELLRWVAVNMWFGVIAERAIYFVRGVTPDQLDKNAELEVSLIQCLVELCPDADWSIAAVMIKALNLCAVSPNRRFVNGESVVPLYKVKLWAFGAQRLLTHFSWPYRLLAWYCARKMHRFSSKRSASAPIFSAKDSKLVVDFASSVTRAKNRANNNVAAESPETILGKSTASPTTEPAARSHQSTPALETTTNDIVPKSTTPPAVSLNPTYVVSTQDDASLFNVMIPHDPTTESDTNNSAADEETLNLDATGIPKTGVTLEVDKTAAIRSSESYRSIETSYRSVCLVHEIAAHMLAGRMEIADSALAELIAIRSQNVPIVSRVSMDRLHSKHILPFTRWGTLRTQLLRSLVQGIQGKYKEAVEVALFVQQEAEATGDTETRCAAVLHSTQFLLLAGHVEMAAQQLSELLLDSQTVAVLMSDAQHYSALRATWILLEANDHTRDRVVDGIDFVVDERFIVELKHFVNGLEIRTDHRFETLYYLLCVVEAALNAWQRMEETMMKEAQSPTEGETHSLHNSTDGSAPTTPRSPPILAAKRAMLLDQRSSLFLNLKLLSKRALDLLGKASNTGAFFLPAYHFLNAKLILLMHNHSSSLRRVERELASAVKSCWQLGRWSQSEIENSIEELHYDLIRPLVQVHDEDNAITDLDEPPTARTCS